MVQLVTHAPDAQLRRRPCGPFSSSELVEHGVVLTGGIEHRGAAAVVAVEGPPEGPGGVRAAAGLALRAAPRRAPSPPPAAPAPCGRGGRLLVLGPLLGL